MSLYRLPLFGLLALSVSMGQPQADPTSDAESVVLGEVASATSYWTADSLIYTDFVVTPAVMLKGQEQSAVVVQVPGGIVGDTQMSVSHAPELKSGEKVLLFLTRSAKDKDRFEVVQGEHGKYKAGSPAGAAAVERAFRSIEEKQGQKQTYKRLLAESFLLTTTTTSATTTSTCYASQGVRWSTNAVTFKIGASVPATWATSINAAAATWSSAGAAFSLKNNLSSTNELLYLDPVAKYGTGYSNTYAVATSWTNTSTNQIVKATIEINTRFQWSTTAQANMADVQNILTHEFGHWMRLGDLYSPTTCSEATMWGTSPLGETKKRTLEQSDINGLISLYGSSSSIAAPVLTAPANGATGVSTGASLTWNTASGATSYDVYFGTSSAPPLVATIATTSYKPATMAAGTRYYWRVVAKNSAFSATSTTASFTTATAGLQTPVLRTPANGATGVSRTPTISWNAVTGATSYDVYLGTSSNPTLIGTLSGTSATVSGLQGLTTYYWRIVARNSTGSASSATWSFKTY